MDKILILDFGSQFSQLIARRVRELHVYCELHPFDWPIKKIKAFAAKGIILSGGPKSVIDSSYQADPALLELGVPVLGICYGMQWMTYALGGEVETSSQREFGYATVTVFSSLLTSGIFDEVAETMGEKNEILHVWMSHGDRVKRLAKGFYTAGTTPHCPHAIIADDHRRLYGLQFHPEVTHTPSGTNLLARFVHELCQTKSEWTVSRYIEERIQDIKTQVGSDQVILALSGGVDSSVAAVLIHRAIGKQLHCVFVDHGLLRLNEAQQVKDYLVHDLGVNVTFVNAQERFMTALRAVSDPEKKRKIIGAQFIEVFEEQAAKISTAQWLAQGTIYPDVIESADSHTQKAQAIKSHHNVGGLPDTLRLQLLEPLRDLFKDEVRALGIELGLPKQLLYRHPFPGPGLAVRILGEITTERVNLLQLADAIFIKELRLTQDKDGISWYDKVSQAFAVFLPVRSVGVMGDNRTYDYVIALRAVITDDFMTAHWAHLPCELLSRVSNRIINEVSGINRVVYDVSSKPPSTIEWE